MPRRHGASLEGAQDASLRRKRTAAGRQAMRKRHARGHPMRGEATTSTWVNVGL